MKYFLLLLSFLISTQVSSQKRFFNENEFVFTNLDTAINHKNEVRNLALHYENVPLKRLHEIGSMPNLKFLSITGVFLQEVPPVILQLKHLKGLTISSGLKTIPEKIKTLEHLEYLNMASNSITEIPDWIGDMKNLKTLILRYNPIEEISNNISNCKSLRYLDLSYMWKPKSIPESIGLIPNLEELYINNSDLYWLPTSVKGLKKLRILDASGNHLQELPGDITSLKKLKILNLRINEISKLPPHFNKLRSLDSLDLAFNPINDEPELKLPYSLKYLKLVNSRLTEFPKALKSCINLESLEITRSKITLIPDWISKLQKLKSLALKYNQITTIPLSLTSNKALERVNLDSNLIDAIPPEIFALPQLKQLLLSRNKIRHIPEEILKSRSLEYVAVTKSNIDSSAYHQLKNLLKGRVVFQRADFISFSTGEDCPCYSDKQLPKQIKNGEPEIFTKSEIPVRFSGKENDMQEFFTDNVNFPEITLFDKTGKFADTVLLKFAVIPYSGITYVSPVTFKTEEAKNEAMRLLRLSCPYWLPGSFSGREVQVWCQVAFIFEQSYENGHTKKELTVKIVPLYSSRRTTR